MDEKEDKRPVASIVVPSKGGEEKKDEDMEPAGPAPPKQDKDKDAPEMTEEDLKLKEDLEMAFERCKDSDANVQKTSLEYMSKEMREATSSMTSVPKPLKFLSPFYADLKTVYSTTIAASNKLALADVLSVLGMVMGQEDRECLKYKLEGNKTDLGSWGHEYVRHLAGEVGQAWAESVNESESTDYLLPLVTSIVPFHMAHNAEAEAIDLLMETSQLSTLPSSGHIDESNYARVCLYLLRCGDYLGDPDEAREVFSVAFDLYFNLEKYPDAVRVAVKLDDNDRVGKVFAANSDSAVAKQMGYILGRHGSGFVCDDEDVDELIGNVSAASLFAGLARELDVLEPKAPEDIYKSHLAETGSFTRNTEDAPTDSARHNLASTFVNAFVNAGYTTDTLVTPADSKWLYRNKGDAVMSVAASLGMILQWNLEEMSELDKYLEDSDPYSKAGALLGLGLTCTNTRSEFDPAKSVLEEQLDPSVKVDKSVRVGALLGLGIAYAGSARDDISELLTPFVIDTSAAADMEIVAIAGYALGLVFVGTANEDVASVIAERFMEASPAELNNPLATFLGLGLGLLFLGKTDAVAPIVMTLGTVEHALIKSVCILVETLAFCGTGNVLKVQEMLHLCAEHPAADREKELEERKKEKAKEAAAAGGEAAGGAAAAETKDDEEEESNSRINFMYQSFAVLGMSLVCLGEELSSDMLARTAEHLLQYGDQPVRKAVPLALAMAHISDPDYSIVDTLSKLTHDQDEATASSAIMALGLVGAGTNNSRIAGMLRQLTVFYAKQPNQLFITRLAQGLLHMGKGLMTLNPLHSDKLLQSGSAIGALLAVGLCCLDLNNTLLTKHHYLLFAVAPAMRPRCVVALDEDLEPVHVDVRVGQAVETVGQAGRPKTLTGFQTHTTPVLLGAKDRAELADDTYEPLTSVIEGFVIVRKKAEEAGSGAGAGAGAAAGSS